LPHQHLPPQSVLQVFELSPHHVSQMPFPQTQADPQSYGHVDAFSSQAASQTRLPQTHWAPQSLGQLPEVSPQAGSQAPFPHWQASMQTRCCGLQIRAGPGWSAQLTQASPLAPQAETESPRTQFPCWSQQPSKHVAGEQGSEPPEPPNPASKLSASGSSRPERPQPASASRHAIETIHDKGASDRRASE
jgi:hypothetical protein